MAITDNHQETLHVIDSITGEPFPVEGDSATGAIKVTGIDGIGDVDGPASSTDNAIARFDGTTGKLLQNGVATIGDAGGIATTIADTGNEVGLTITQNDVTNNPRAVEIVNAGTNKALYIDQNGNAGTAIASSGAILLDNTGNTGIGLNVYTNIGATASASLISIFSDNTAYDTDVVTIRNDSTSASSVGLRVTGGAGSIGVLVDGNSTGAAGFRVRNQTAVRAGTGTAAMFVLDNNEATGSGDVMYFLNEAAGKGLQIDHNNTNISLDIDKDVTNKSSSDSGGALRIFQTSVVDDAATYTKSGAVVSITSNVTETSGTITDSAIVLDINQTHADATGTVVDIDNDGKGVALSVRGDGGFNTNARVVDIRVNGDLGASTGTNGVYIYSDTAHTVADNAQRALLKVENDNASAINNTLNIKQDGTGRAIFIDNNESGRSIEIDHDFSSASSSTGVVIDVDNASTGGAIGLDISNVTATSGTVIGQRIALPSGGTNNYALQLSDTGGTSAGGVTFGTDVELYRSAANTLNLGTNDNLVIGVSNGYSGWKLTTGGATTQHAAFINTSASGSGGGAGIVGASNDGAALASGDRMGFYLFGGSYDASNSTNNSAGIVGFTSEAWSSTNRGAELRFEVTANGSTSRGVAAKFGNDSKLYFGTGTDTNLYRDAADRLKTDDKLVAALGIGVGNSAAATTLGAVTNKMEVFDASGASLGFVPIYDAIT